MNDQFTPATPGVQRQTPFQKDPVAPGKIVFLGDSITEMGDWKGILKDRMVINRGVGGDMTRGVLRRLKEITDFNPSKIFILLGINDIGKKIATGAIAENYLKIIRDIRHKCPATIIYVQSVLPVNPGLLHILRRYDKQDQILALNRILAAHANEAGYKFLDIGRLFTDSEGRLGAQYTYDGLHLKQAAYAIWVDYLKQQGFL